MITELQKKKQMNRRDFFNTGANLISGVAINKFADNAMNARFDELATWLSAKYEVLAVDFTKAIDQLNEEFAYTTQCMDKRFERIEVQQSLLLIWATVLTFVSGIDLITPLISQGLF